jgi:hypothetical protein
MGQVYKNVEYTLFMGQPRPILDSVVNFIPPTPSPSVTPTMTVTPTPTSTPILSPSVTPTVTTTPTLTSTNTPTPSVTPTYTPTITPSPTLPAFSAVTTYIDNRTSAITTGNQLFSSINIGSPTQLIIGVSTEIIGGGTVLSVSVDGVNSSQISQQVTTVGDTYNSSFWGIIPTASTVDIQVNIASGKQTRGSAINLFGINTTSGPYKVQGASNTTTGLSGRLTTLNVTGLTGNTSVIGLATYSNHTASATWTGLTAQTNLSTGTLRSSGALRNSYTGSTLDVYSSGGTPSSVTLAFWS